MSLSIVLEVFYNGVWNVAPVYADSVTFKRGYTDRGNGDPNQLSCRIENFDDMWRPSNPESPLYENGGRNIPVRLTVEGQIRAFGEAASWVPDQSPDFREDPPRGERWVDLEVADVQRRIGQWSDVVRSTMEAGFTQYSDLLCLASFEDPSGATAISNLVPGGTPVSFTGTINFGQEDAPPGAGTSAELKGGAKFTVPGLPSASAGYTVFFCAKIPNTLPAALTPMFWWHDTNYLYAWDVGPTDFRLHVLDAGAAIIDDHTGFSPVPPGQWVIYRFKVSTVGGNVQVEPARYDAGGSSIIGFTSSAPGAAGKFQYLREDLDPALDGMLISYAGCYKTTDPLFSVAVIQGLNGWAGETAAARWLRLCTEQGVAASVIGSASTTAPMGPQKPDTFENLRAECVATEDALEYGARNASNLLFRTRASRQNVNAVLAVDFNGGDIVPPMPEKYDDVGTENKITLKNRDGRELTVVDTTSIMSTNPPPAGVGVAQKTYDVNFQSSDTMARGAEWYLARGTLPGSRYPTVTVDAAQGPNAAAARLVTIGDRLTITGRTADTLDLQVIGYTEHIDTDVWTITFVCVPNDVFSSGTWDDGRSRWDFLNVTVAADVAPYVGSVGLTTTNVWDTINNATSGYDLEIGGERVTVTLLGAWSGSGPYTATATVTRSVNGVVKTLKAGTAVHVADSLRWGW